MDGYSCSQRKGQMSIKCRTYGFYSILFSLPPSLPYSSTLFYFLCFSISVHLFLFPREYPTHLRLLLITFFVSHNRFSVPFMGFELSLWPSILFPFNSFFVMLSCIEPQLLALLSSSFLCVFCLVSLIILASYPACLGKARLSLSPGP